MGERVTVRLGHGKALGLMLQKQLWPYLREKGLEPRTMTCREDGAELVYEGERVTKGSSVTNGNCGGGNEEN